MSAVLICVCIRIYNTCMSARMSGAADTLRPPFAPLDTNIPQLSSSSIHTHTLVVSYNLQRTNTFFNLDKYILQFGQIQKAFWTNTSCNLDKTILQFGYVHFVIRTFYPCATRHHILELSSGNIQTLPGHVLLIPLFPLIILAYSSYLV